MPTQTISNILNICNARTPLKTADLLTNLVNGAPGTLDTLKEIDNAINNDPNFATTLTTLINTKEQSITIGNSSQYWRGDKTWVNFPTTVSTFTNDAGYQTAAQVIATKVNASINADKVPWSGVTTKPTTLSGYGITDLTGLSTIMPKVAGTGAIGTSPQAARADHVHPAGNTQITLTESDVQFNNSTYTSINSSYPDYQKLTPSGGGQDLIYRYTWTLGTTITSDVINNTPFKTNNSRYILIVALSGGGGGTGGTNGYPFGGEAGGLTWTIIDKGLPNVTDLYYTAIIGMGGIGGTPTVYPDNSNTETSIYVSCKYSGQLQSLIVLYSTSHQNSKAPNTGVEINPQMHPIESTIYYSGHAGAGTITSTEFPGFGGGSTFAGAGGKGGDAVSSAGAGANAAPNTGAGGGAGGKYNNIGANGGNGGSGLIKIYYSN